MTKPGATPTANVNADASVRARPADSGMRGAATTSPSGSSKNIVFTMRRYRKAAMAAHSMATTATEYP